MWTRSEKMKRSSNAEYCFVIYYQKKTDGLKEGDRKCWLFKMSPFSGIPWRSSA